MSNDYSDVQIESNLPKPWEEEETFNDVLYDWMSKAPWLLISAALHFVIGVIVAAIPWSAFDQAPEQIIEAGVEQPPEEGAALGGRRAGRPRVRQLEDGVAHLVEGERRAEKVREGQRR